DHLKAPTFSNRATLDEKLRFIRHRHGPPVDLLMLGSSTTLWGVDGDALHDVLPDRVMLNVGVRDLKIHQALNLASLYKSLMGEIRDVVMISTMLDFESCAPGSASLLDHASALAYASGESGELSTQIRELDPLGILRSARDIAQRRTSPAASPDSLHFDSYGGILLDLPRSAVPDLVWNGSLPAPDERCHAALARLARELSGDGIALTFVIAPMRPSYLRRHDPDGVRLAVHRSRLAASARKSGFRLLDAHGDLAFADEVFFDAYHVRAPFTHEMTRWIAIQLKK
ncbi:MAG: hypothetical protein R3C97_17690, partial [Geminicoccaceae bacterium]